MTGFLRRRIFVKYAVWSIVVGAILSAAVLATYRERVRTRVVSEAATEVATLAAQLARPAAALAADGEQTRASEVLAVFASFPYAICAELRGAEELLAAWPRIGCGPMREGLDLSPPVAIQGATFTVRIDESVLRQRLHEETILQAGLAAGLGLLLLASGAAGFFLFVERPVRQLSRAMSAYDRGRPEHADVRTEDEIGRLVGTYNAMLDREAARTGALREAHEAIMENIGYAARLQESLLPDPAAMTAVFGAHAVLWRPRDSVGGDLYRLVADGPGGAVLAMADCTGHGVQGGLLTMLVAAELDAALAARAEAGPAALLARMSDGMRRRLTQRTRDYDVGAGVDGFDGAICRRTPDGGLLVALARQSILMLDRDGTVQRLRGDRLSLGYPDTPPAPVVAEQRIAPAPGRMVVLVTDGITDQPGGPRGHGLGWRRLSQALAAAAPGGPEAVADAARTLVDEWTDDRGARDDQTLLVISLEPGAH
ncbi:SpoIIE family protein phosphatase [Pseudoroseicyclus tamaricis]|uniref:SpoIIE family protein phosphatase n=1 Tax=Pseudoroseicyclus tamaricis TaxID=2705421 RepID=A0A6B2JRN9_9RHOB|nr:SpoIIE family protein phosphatase [Pseudoroseicyclus tamaricis]NDV01237.1 SpoIIE family protein phosphatase [Pseudoroseicyclus tamaricis]